jgi:hypothetical protein
MSIQHVQMSQTISSDDLEVYLTQTIGVDVSVSYSGMGVIIQIGSAVFGVSRGYDDMPVFIQAPSLVEGFSNSGYEEKKKIVRAVDALLSI